MGSRLKPALEAITLAPLARGEERAALLDEIDIVPGDHILEAGAWDGYLTEKLDEHDGPVTALERMADHVVALRARFPRVKVIEGLQERMPIYSESVDRIVALVSLHHINVIGFLDEARRVIRGTGRLAIVEVGRGSSTAAFLDGEVNKLAPHGHRGIYFTPSEWRAHLRNAGFAHVQADELPLWWRFSSMKQAIAYCRAVFGLRADDAAIVAAIETLDPEIDVTGVRWRWPLVRVVADVR